MATPIGAVEEGMALLAMLLYGTGMRWNGACAEMRAINENAIVARPRLASRVARRANGSKYLQEEWQRDDRL